VNEKHRSWVREEPELTVSAYHGRWIPNAGRPLTIKKALQFLRSRSIVIPSHIRWGVGRLQEGEYRDGGLLKADAYYFRSDVGLYNVDSLIAWEDFTVRGKVPVIVREEVLRSDEHALYVFSHEIFEIQELKRVVDLSGGAISLRRLAQLIDPVLDGSIHKEAVRYGDSLVRKLREERGIGHDD
jgi:hypothetical protein